MSSTALCAVILLVCALTFSAAQTSCKGRCGAEYYRGSMCQCDYNCPSYGECCKDFESQCTTKNSCRGRCGENFKRGRLCSCDSDCVNYKQCCSDYKNHCDADEEISGAASATAPVKTNSCDKVNDNKPKEPAVNEATEQTSTFSEGNNADDNLIPLVSPTSYPQDDVSDDMYSQIFPNDEFSNNAVTDPYASPVPETTSGYGSSTADLLDQITTTEPTQDPDTLEFSTETPTVFPDNEPTQADDSPLTVYPTTEEVPSESTAETPELETIGQAEAQLDDFPEEQTAASSDKPEVTTPPSSTVFDPLVASTVPTDATSTVLENSQVTTIPASSTLDPTPIPEATTSNPEPADPQKDVTTGDPSPPADREDPSVSVSPAGSENLSELDALTTQIPTSTDAVQDDTTDDVTPGGTTADPLSVTKALDPAQTLNKDDTRDYQADDSNDTNLCSGRPIGAATTLRNGTTVVFRGHYFWVLDRNRVPGPARGITQVWGVPSPIDTLFTRCNCQGKTYIFKGTKYWRFENDVLDSGYPKAIERGFDGLRGHITAALSVPQYQRRRESVYFFKRGGQVQTYSYQYGTSPTCGVRKPQITVHTVRNRIVRQAVSLLGPSINIRMSWRGFPTTVTAAVSVPNNREPEGYKYYVFSRSKSYNVRMDSERPVIATPAPAANTSPQSNDFIKCPKKV